MKSCDQHERGPISRYQRALRKVTVTSHIAASDEEFKKETFLHMLEVKAELEAVLQDFGARPYGFFSILDDSDNPNLDLRKQNTDWHFIKSERWHSLDLSSYILWSISDNGDLLW